MSNKRKTLLAALAACLILLAGSAALVTLFLPASIEKRLVRGIELPAGLTLRLTFRRIGFLGADIENFSLAGSGEPAISAGSIRINYSPGSLLRKKISRVAVDGLTVSIEELRGIQDMMPVENEKSSGKEGITIPATVEELSVNNGLIMVPAGAHVLPVPFTLNASSDLEANELRAGLNLLSPGGGNLQMDGTFNFSRNQGNFRLAGTASDPVPMTGDISGTVRYEDGKVSGSGSIRTEIASVSDARTNFVMNTPLPLAGSFSFTAGPDGNWQGEFTGSDGISGTPIVFTYKNTECRFQPPRATLAAEGNMKTAVTDYQVTVPAVSLTGPAFEIRMPQLSMHGSASLSSETDNAMKLDGEISFSNAGLLVPGSDLALQGISAAIPWQWPLTDTGTAGSLHVDGIRWETRQLGGLTSTISQQGLGLAVNGSHVNELLPGLRLDFSGRGVFSDNGLTTSLDFSLPHYTASWTDLGKFTPGADGILLAGDIEANGSLAYGPAGLNGMLKTRMANGSLAMPGKMSIDTIALFLTFADLPALRSEAHQELTFARARIGDMVVEDGSVLFQVETPRSVFIEKSGFRWCGGHVYTYALQITPEINEYDVILYGDGLKLADILEQFGVANTAGNGAVNGRIPLQYRNGLLRFEEGFLYSTPGEGGTIRFSKADMLMKGVPANTPQFHQLDLAVEALRNFRYNWVKLLLRSEGEECIMQMQLDGKPAEPLPFAYDKNIGSFVRVQAASGQSIDQPIRLDVNFRLPLDKILGYSGGINKLMEKMK